MYYAIYNPAPGGGWDENGVAQNYEAAIARLNQDTWNCNISIAVPCNDDRPPARHLSAEQIATWTGTIKQLPFRA